MNRIQQILEKAEKDQTVRRAVSIDTLESQRFAPSAPYAPAPPSGNGHDATDPRRASTVETGTALQEPDRAADGDRPVVDDGSSRAPRAVGGLTLHPLLVAGFAPASPAAEQYRSLRSRIAEAGQSPRVIQITSPGHRDGKTVTALNLALTMAQEFQRRVLVIDADLRRPSRPRVARTPARTRARGSADRPGAARGRADRVDRLSPDGAPGRRTLRSPCRDARIGPDEAPDGQPPKRIRSHRHRLCSNGRGRSERGGHPR